MSFESVAQEKSGAENSLRAQRLDDKGAKRVAGFGPSELKLKKKTSFVLARSVVEKKNSKSSTLSSD